MCRKEAKEHPEDSQSSSILLSKHRGSESPQPQQRIGKKPEVLQIKQLAENYQGDLGMMLRQGGDVGQEELGHGPASH